DRRRVPRLRPEDVDARGAVLNRAGGVGGVPPLEDHLREVRSSGRKILAPYLTAGFPTPEAFPDLLAGVIDAGADLLEIGIPFSDPLMDGSVIQRASDIALKGETRPPAAIRMLGSLQPACPFVFMTYVNPILAMGEAEFASRSVAAGSSGTIVPDLPVEEAATWVKASDDAGLACVFLTAPTTPRDRLEQIVSHGSGFIYCVSLLGVTGVREAVSERAAGVVSLVRELTDRPALVGVGVSTPTQAADVCTFADGVIVGSAVIKAVLDDGIDAAVGLVKSMREALDG
ncbi:MAG: tryptophan synthase subunit alpha, partial [Actinomycetota bacterium]